MNKKRRDKQGRILNKGESQRSDGRYMYRYCDLNGDRQTVYSWRLTAADRIPAGVRDCMPLREQEKQIQKDLTDGIRAKDAEQVTVNDRMDMWFTDQRKYLDPDTIVSYRTLYDKHMRDTLGRRKLKNVSHSDLARLYAGMIEDKGLKPSTAQSLNACVGQMFQLAVQDDLIRRNPAVGATAKLALKHSRDNQKKTALTAEQQARYLAFLAGSTRFRRMLNLFIVLFGTGMRISEAVGLVRTECNFRQGRIHVRRELRYRMTEKGTYEYIKKEKTKTFAGMRDIPMFPAVRTALMEEANKSRKVKDEFKIDGVSGFIFLNNAGKPYTPTHVYDLMQQAQKAYNEQEQAAAKAGGRPPELLPKFGPHTCRHSFATRLYENHVDPIVIKTLMGHESFREAAETYIDVSFDVTKTTIAEIQGKMNLAV